MDSYYPRSLKLAVSLNRTSNAQKRQWITTKLNTDTDLDTGQVTLDVEHLRSIRERLNVDSNVIDRLEWQIDVLIKIIEDLRQNP